jgi:hypothetical protein
MKGLRCMGTRLAAALYSELHFALLRRIFLGEGSRNIARLSGQNPRRGYTPGTQRL